MFTMELPTHVVDILNILENAGYEAYVVGGCVRDALLDRPVHDYDICTSAKPEKVLSLFEHVIPTGLKHGTVTVVSESNVEITTFRKETTYKDHRHPDEVYFTDTIECDLSRRDFTINAMAYSPCRGLIDPFGGTQDVDARMIRCVNDPDERFNEDALRMIRAFRFSAKLNFKLEPNTADAIKRNTHLITYVAIERVMKELKEILKYDPSVIAEMVDLLEPWIPELKQALSCQQHSRYHYTDVLHHTLDAISYLEPFDETLALALLFHDLGKMQAKTTVDGIDHFYGHAKHSYEIAKRLCQDLKLTKEQSRWIPFYVLHHDDSFVPKLKNIYKYCVTFQLDETHLMNLLQIRYCDGMAHSEIGREKLSEVEAFKDLYHANTYRPMKISDLMIDGNDIIENTSFRSASIHETLNECLEYVFYQPEKNTYDALMKHIKKLKS